MAEIKDVLQGVLVKALNFTEAEVSSLYDEEGNPKDDAQDIVLGRHADQVKKAKDAAKSDREGSHSRGMREKGEEWERNLKDAGVELGDAKGADAVQKLKDHIEAQTKPSDLDDDKVKNSALYRKMEKDYETKLKTMAEDHGKVLSDRDAKEQRDRTLSTVKGMKDDLVKTLKPILPEDPEKARRQLSLLDNSIEAHTYEKEGEDWYVLDKDGKRLETPNGAPIMAKQFLEAEIKATYELPKSSDKGSAGDPSRGAANKGGVKLHKPANRDDLAKQLYEITEDPDLSPTEKAEKSAELRELAKDVA